MKREYCHLLIGFCVIAAIAALCQTRVSVPSQVLRSGAGQTIVDLSQMRNYVSLQRYVCAGGQPGSDCTGLEYYKFTMPDGTIRDFMISQPDAFERADVAKGPPKWTVTALK